VPPLAAIAAASLQLGYAAVDNYPSRPVRIVVGFGAGAAADTPARLLAQAFSATSGQQFLVENKPGAGSNLAASYVAHAAHDGYTLLMATGAQTNYAAVTVHPEYDVEKDFMPIVRVADLPNILVTNPSLGVDNLHDLIELSKRKPGQIFYGASGVGSTTHIAGELLNQMAGIELVAVQYPGSAQALTDVLAGRIQLFIAPASAVVQQLGSGQLKALAITTARRSAIAPNVPTMAEAGLPGYDLGIWFGLLAPAGTPRPIIDRLAGAADAALGDDRLRDRLQQVGFEPGGGGPDDFSAYIAGEVKKATAVAISAKMRQ
jgi:tripartite-type tricarboxylate transporter receptor subunit TctC